MLGTRHADRYRKPDFGPHSLPDGLRDVGRRPEEVDGTGDVKERFVDRDALDERREVIEDGHDFVGESLVFAEVPADELQAGAQLRGSPPRHPGHDAEWLGLVRRGQHNASAYRDWLAAKRRIEKLFDRRVEGIEVGVEDGGLAIVRHRAMLTEQMFDRFKTVL
jgi:hypothetical protein